MTFSLFLLEVMIWWVILIYAEYCCRWFYLTIYGGFPIVLESGCCIILGWYIYKDK